MAVTVPLIQNPISKRVHSASLTRKPGINSSQ